MPNELLTRREAAEIGGIPLKAIDKAVEQRVVKARRRRGGTWLEANDVAALVLLHQLPPGLPVALKRRLRNWLAGPRPLPAGAEFSLSEAVVVSVTEHVVEARRRALEYARLREKYIETNPAVMGGAPVIRGTRLPVRSLARLIELGERPEVLREDHPGVSEKAHDIAVVWAAAHPRRGRPVPPWRAEIASQERRAGSAA